MAWAKDLGSRTLKVNLFLAALVGLALLLGATSARAVTANCFSDVSTGDWFHDFVCWMFDAGLTSGYPDGTFRPNNNISRAEVAVFMQQLSGAGTAGRIVDADKLDGYDAAALASGGLSGPLKVFPSTSITSGDAGGRAGTAALCIATDPDSHLVSIEEIENAWIETGVIFAAYSGEIWVDNAKLGTLVNFYNHPHLSEWSGQTITVGVPRNCNGWTSGSGSGFGYTLAPNGQNINQAICSDYLPVACGKH